MRQVLSGFSALLVIVFFFQSAARAGVNHLDIGASVLGHGLNSVVNDPTGSTGTYGTLYYDLKAQAHFNYASDWDFSPALLYMPDFLLPYKAPSGLSKSTYMILELPATWTPMPTFSLEMGLALMRYTIEGAGGTTVLNNGNSSNSFAVPGSNQTATTIGALLGPSLIYNDFRFTLDLLAESPLSSAKRTLSLMFSINWNCWTFGR